MRNYINPQVVRDTMDRLLSFKEQHPEIKTPMAKVCEGEPITERAIFVRAAKRLGWNVVVSQGKVYENGRFVFTLPKNEGV